MSEINCNNYNIGLDIGTSSVGWAVVNSDTNKIVKKNGKQLWGVRLFDSGKVAAERRNFRSTRRRFDRRRKRIKLLQEMFYDEIMKVDKDFFIKMKESFYRQDDELNKTKPLSKEEKNAIKMYYREYKTIYHLRKHLMENVEEDIRLIYLAIHHIIKYRGNFLRDGDDFSVKNLNVEKELENLFEMFYTQCEEINFNIIDISEIDYVKLANSILFHTKNDKKNLVKEVLQSAVDKQFITEFTKLIVGNEFSVSKLFNIELDENITIKFEGTKYEESRDKIEQNIKDKIEILDLCKNIYNVIFLKEMFNGEENESLSCEMVERHKRHKDDLRKLKEMFKHDDDLYKSMFKTKKDKKGDKLCTYDKYIHNQISLDEVRKEIEKLIKKINIQSVTDEYNNDICKRIENGKFLPRITDVDNGKFPYQLNKIELRKIIEKQGEMYPFLLEKYSDNEYKLERLLSFKIPYYVGPLNNTTNKRSKENENAWMKPKINVKQITPYNFEDVIDKEQVAEQFILKMISHCTYLIDKHVIPGNSILYSKFKVISELKQIKINNQKLPLDVQKKIIEELFMRVEGTITDKVFRNYIISHDLFPMYDRDFKITGYSSDKGFASNMSSYVFFFGKDGVFKNTDYKIKDAENIIKWITIFEDKSILESKIRNEYKNLSDDVVKRILSKKFKGWSRLSEELLTTKHYINKENNTKMSILDLMEETDKNFSQIINSRKYKFQEMINSLNNKLEINKVNYELVENLQTSPATKKGIYQALKVVEEIVKYMGSNPKNIMIEMARSDEEKKRSERRKNYLTNLYEINSDKIFDYNNLYDQLSNCEKIDSDKLFLYFIQEGKSLYSMEPIDIDELFTEKYEVDHIIPRSLVKNDSIENKALVLRVENQEKAANFVLPAKFRNQNNIKWWDHLRDIGLISTKKHDNLIRYKYSDDDIDGFISRQLVETRQITKHVVNILSNLYKDTSVVSLHANLSHNYREKFELYKYRNLNDHHHAHDAYLAAVIGNFTKNYLKKVNFEKLREINNKLFESKQYDDAKYGYVINSMDSRFLCDYDTGEMKYDIDEFNKIVSNTLYNNYDIKISKKTEIKTGKFYHQNASKKGNPGAKLKDNLPTDKYGSYNNVESSYTAIVKWMENSKEKQKLVGIPIYLDVKLKSNPKIIDEYLHNLLKLDANIDIEIVKSHIPINQLLNWDGKICYLIGARTLLPYVEVCNAKQFIIDKKHLIEWKYVLNRLFNKKEKDFLTDDLYSEKLDDVMQYIIEKIDKEYLLYKDNIVEIKKIFGKDNFHNFSILDKEKAILETFKLLKCDRLTANYKIFNNKESFARKNSKTISNVKLISKSVTGLWEHENEF